MKPAPITSRVLLSALPAGGGADRFRTARVANIDLRSNQTLRYNLTMEIADAGTSVAVTIDAQALLAVSSSSVGQALSQDQVAALPLIGGDVLDLINTLPGFRSGAGIPGANNDTMAGASSSTINTVRDGLSVTDGRFPERRLRHHRAQPGYGRRSKTDPDAGGCRDGQGQRAGGDYHPLGN
jgi:hypothetical protein